MKFQKFEVENYRSLLEKCEIRISQLTTIIGPNNEGKSNILRAIVSAVKVLESIAEEVASLRKEDDALSVRLWRTERVYDWSRDYPLSRQKGKRKGTGRSVFTLNFLLNEEELDEILKNAKLNGKARFSPIEQKSIMRDFKRSLSITARAPFLEEILKLRYSDGAALKSGDIASFFYVTKGCTRSRTSTAFNILKYYVRNHKEKTSIQLDDAVFLPLENNDKILDELSAVSAFFSDSERGKALFDTLDIVKASGYDFVKYTKDIAHNLKKDKTDIVHKILKGAAEYAYQDKISNNKSIFS